MCSVCKFVGGKKRNTVEGKINGLYPLFSSSLNVDNWIDEFDYNEECIIINTINGSGKFNLQHANKFCATSNTIIFNTNNINLTLYIYYYGLNNIDTISNLANGSTKKKMGKTEISKFILKIPKNKQLIQDLENTFQQIELLQNQVKIVDELYKQLIKELSKESMPPQNTNIVVSVTTENVAETQEKIEVNVPKKKVVKKTNNKVIIKPKQLIIEDEEEELL